MLPIPAAPDGPWQRTGPDPILKPSATAADFDSHRVDDSCLVRRGGQYRLYYKGRQLGLAPHQPRIGLATASRADGPYARHPGAGIGCIVAPYGSQGGTLQYSTDGLLFRRIRVINPPRAPGPYREDRCQ